MGCKRTKYVIWDARDKSLNTYSIHVNQDLRGSTTLNLHQHKSRSRQSTLMKKLRRFFTQILSHNLSLDNKFGEIKYYLLRSFTKPQFHNNEIFQTICWKKPQIHLNHLPNSYFLTLVCFLSFVYVCAGQQATSV